MKMLAFLLLMKEDKYLALKLQTKGWDCMDLLKLCQEFSRPIRDRLAQILLIDSGSSPLRTIPRWLELELNLQITISRSMLTECIGHSSQLTKGIGLISTLFEEPEMPTQLPHFLETWMLLSPMISARVILEIAISCLLAQPTPSGTRKLRTYLLLRPTIKKESLSQRVKF